MRKTKVSEGKKHVYDTEKADEVATRSFGTFGDPASDKFHLVGGKLRFIFGRHLGFQLS